MRTQTFAEDSVTALRLKLTKAEAERDAIEREGADRRAEMRAEWGREVKALKDEHDALRERVRVLEGLLRRSLATCYGDLGALEADIETALEVKP